MSKPETWTAEAQDQWQRDCLRWRGVVLTGEKSHWCHDWDGLPIDETTTEFQCCACFDGGTHAPNP